MKQSQIPTAEISQAVKPTLISTLKDQLLLLAEEVPFTSSPHQRRWMAHGSYLD